MNASGFAKMVGISRSSLYKYIGSYNNINTHIKKLNSKANRFFLFRFLYSCKYQHKIKIYSRKITRIYFTLLHLFKIRSERGKRKTVIFVYCDFSVVCPQVSYIYWELQITVKHENFITPYFRVGFYKLLVFSGYLKT